MDASQIPVRPLCFGVYEVDRKTRQLRRQGSRIRLQDQPFQVLCMLLDNAGSVVTREQLRQALWPGSVYVDFDHGLNNAIARLREALSDDAASPTYIETLPRLGYRFIYPIESPPVAPPVATPRRRLAPWLAGALVAALVFGLWLALRDRAPDAATGDAVATIAVVPFASLSADPEDGYFADGLSEVLMTHLSRIRELRVAGIGSSFHFKDSREPPAQIAKALNVDHLLQGSVRRSGQRVRITTRLVEAATDRQLWAETFERDFRDIFAIEDEIALSVSSALQVRLVNANSRQLQQHGTRNAEAYRLYLMGMAQMRARGVRLDREGARRLFEQAITLDPGFPGAHAGLASYYFNNASSRNQSPEESWRLGLAAAERAYALGPDIAEAMRVMASFEMLRHRHRGESAAYGRAASLFERAVAAEPANSYVHFDFGRAIQWHEPRRALELFDRADELDPLVPVASSLGVLALSRMGMDEAARLRLHTFLARAGESYGSRVVGALESYAGHLDVAAAALSRTSSPFSLDTGPILMLAGIHRSLDDHAAADAAFGMADDALTTALRRAATLSADGNHRAAFEHLDRERGKYPDTQLLDLAAARFALIAGDYGRAAEILEKRLPDLASGAEDVTAPRVLPALDLAMAWSQTGRSDAARELLEKVAKFLDGPDAPRLPMFTVQRARAHALAGRAEEAREALDRAFAAGFRMTCHLDLHPQPLLYADCIDVDPAFSALRRDGSFPRWLARIRDENRAQRDALRLLVRSQ